MSRFTLGLLLAGLLFTGLSHGQEPRKETKKDEKPIVVPFEMLKSGHMAVEVKINDQGPYLLIFDTGAPTTLVNNKIAREAGLLKGKAKPAFTLFGSQGEAMIDRLQVGEQVAEKMPAIVMDHPTVEQIAKYLNKPIAGIVGFQFFGRFKTTIDYQAKTMTFVPSGYNPPNVMEAMMKALTAVEGPTVLAPATSWGFAADKGEDTEAPGITVTAVRTDSPVARAGLLKGDRLLTLDGRWTDNLVDLYQAVGRVQAGKTAVLKVKRDGKEIKLEVKAVAGL